MGPWPQFVFVSSISFRRKKLFLSGEGVNYKRLKLLCFKLYIKLNPANSLLQRVF